MLAMLSLLPTTICYKALSTYNPPDARTVHVIPPDTCNHTLFLFFPPDNYSLVAGDGDLLARPGQVCLNSSLQLNGTAMITHDYDDLSFEVYAFVIFDSPAAAEYCGRNDSSLGIFYPVICAYENEGSSEKVQFAVPLAPAIVSLIFTSVALVSSSVLIVTYSLFKQLRTLPGQTVLNLAVAFFASDITSLLFVSLVLSGHPPNPWLLIVETGFFHTRFAWMVIVGFEISRHIYKGMNMKFDSQMKKRKILATYLMLGWVVPVIVGAVSAAVEFSGAEAHKTVKLFGANGRVVVFTPIAMALVINSSIAIFLVVSLRKATMHRNKFGSKVKNGTVKFSKVFLILLTVLGLTWFSVFLSLTITHEAHFLQYIFILLNTTQPLFVCIAFLGNKKMVGHYATLFGCRKETLDQTSSTVVPLRRRMTRFVSIIMSEREFKSFKNTGSLRSGSRTGSILTYVSSHRGSVTSNVIAKEITSSGNKESDSSNDSGITPGKNEMAESVKTYASSSLSSSVFSSPFLAESSIESPSIYGNFSTTSLHHEQPLRKSQALLHKKCLAIIEDSSETEHSESTSANIGFEPSTNSQHKSPEQ